MSGPAPKVARLIANLDAIIEQLYTQYLPLQSHLKDASSPSDIDPELLDCLSTLNDTLQRYSELLPQGPPTTVAPEPRIADAPTAQIPTPPPNSRKTRRPRSKAFDFLLLEAFRHKSAFGYPIGQSSLFDLAIAYSPGTKRPSLVAKLNRWKNDQGWLHWTDPDDLELTDAGAAQRDKLQRVALREGNGPEIIRAFNQAWKIDITLP